MLGLEIALIMVLVLGLLYFFDLGKQALLFIVSCLVLLSSGVLIGLGIHLANMIMGKGLG